MLFECNRFVVYENHCESTAPYTYYLQFNHALFQSVIWRERMLIICSNTPLELSPPSIPYKKCLAEVITDDPANDYELTEAEAEVIAELPSGWKLEDLIAFRGYRLPPAEDLPLPALPYTMRRLAWYYSAPEPAEAEHTLLVHPSQDRPLNAAEWEAIAAHSGDTALLAWLAAVAASPEPAAADPQAEGAYIVDLRQASTFPALRVYAYPESNRRADRLFNVLPSGSLRVSWQSIYRQTYSQ